MSDQLKKDLTYPLSHDDIINYLGYRIPAVTYPEISKRYKKGKLSINDLFIDPLSGIEFDACMILYQTADKRAASGQNFIVGHWCCITRTPITQRTVKLEMNKSGVNSGVNRGVSTANSSNHNQHIQNDLVAINFYDPYGMMIDSSLNKISKKYRKQTGQTRDILKILLANSNYDLITFNPYHHQSYSIRLPNGSRSITTVCGRHCIGFIKYGSTPEHYNKYLKSMKYAYKCPNYDILITKIVDINTYGL